MMKNIREEPIIVKCSLLESNIRISKCKIDENTKLIDNEMYNIYFSKNIYNISEDIVEDPIGEFRYINTNIFKRLFYEIKYFNFTEGKIELKISEILKKNEKIFGFIGPDYDNVAECYKYKFICSGNDSHYVDCLINKDDDDKVEFIGNYKIYNVEGYSFKSKFKNNVYKGIRINNIKIFYLNFFIVILIIKLIVYLEKRKK